jgi:hypothetical protein
MELLSAYDDAESDGEGQGQGQQGGTGLQPVCAARPGLSSAPFVSSALALVPLGGSGGGAKNNQLMLGLNAGVDIMSAPQLGPANPYTGSTGDASEATGMGKRSGVGYIEKTFVEDYSFDTSYKEFGRTNYSSSSSSSSSGGVGHAKGGQ